MVSSEAIHIMLKGKSLLILKSDDSLVDQVICKSSKYKVLLVLKNDLIKNGKQG